MCVCVWGGSQVKGHSAPLSPYSPLLNHFFLSTPQFLETLERCLRLGELRLIVGLGPAPCAASPILLGLEVSDLQELLPPSQVTPTPLAGEGGSGKKPRHQGLTPPCPPGSGTAAGVPPTRLGGAAAAQGTGLAQLLLAGER